MREKRHYNNGRFREWDELEAPPWSQGAKRFNGNSAPSPFRGPGFTNGNYHSICDSNGFGFPFHEAGFQTSNNRFGQSQHYSDPSFLRTYSTNQDGFDNFRQSSSANQRSLGNWPRRSDSDFVFDELREETLLDTEHASTSVLTTTVRGKGRRKSEELAYVCDKKRSGGELRRPIFVDGENLARMYAQGCGQDDKVCCKGILVALKWFLYRGHQVTVVLMQKFVSAALSPMGHTWCADANILEEIQRMGLTLKVSGVVKERADNDFENRTLYEVLNSGGCVFTTRQFRTVKDIQAFHDIKKQRLIMPTFVGEKLHLPLDGPMGRHGKSLPDTLEVNEVDSDYDRVLQHQLTKSEQDTLLMEIDLLMHTCEGLVNFGGTQAESSRKSQNGVGKLETTLGTVKSEYGMDREDGLMRKNQSAPGGLDDEDLKFFISVQEPSPCSSVVSTAARTPQGVSVFLPTSNSPVEGLSNNGTKSSEYELNSVSIPVKNHHKLPKKQEAASTSRMKSAESEYAVQPPTIEPVFFDRNSLAPKVLPLPPKKLKKRRNKEKADVLSENDVQSAESDEKLDLTQVGSQYMLGNIGRVSGPSSSVVSFALPDTNDEVSTSGSTQNSDYVVKEQEK